jgi:type III restriction enzyme
MIELFRFQAEAAAQIAKRFNNYWQDPPTRGTKKNPRKVPFYQALEALTGAGKTPILADAVEQMRAVLPVEPLVIWISKKSVVVSQTYANLQQGGKYHNLIDSYSVHYLAEYRPEFAIDARNAYLFFATVGTFNRKDKAAKGGLLIFRSELDNTESSVWRELFRREDSERRRRPLIVVYDEAHNLTDQQTDLLLELEPDAFLVASATMRISGSLARVLSDLKDAGWTDDSLVTLVPAEAVVGADLVKSALSIGGYQAPMERTIDDMLADMKIAQDACVAARLPFRPKAIYVSKTNIVEGNSFQRDDPKRLFKDRQAPPIVIWRYLVEEKKIDPGTIAVYCALDFDKNFPPPANFAIFKRGDDDYDEFIAGDFQHIIFNLGLQEGWDDPSCYFAYIDKSMGSDVQVEQLVGRVLRQPAARHYDADILNTAHFYIRVDAKAIFAEVVKTVRARLKLDIPSMKVTTYGGGSGQKPVPFAPKEVRTVPSVVADSTDVLQPVADFIEQMPDFRQDPGVNVNGEGSRAVIQQRLSDKTDAELTWVTIEHNNPVTARWVFQRAVQRQYPKALQLAGSDNPKFDARVEIGSKAYKMVETLADDVVQAYFDHVQLAQNQHNPYTVGAVTADKSDFTAFTHALHRGYTGLNPFEKSFCRALDATGLVWCRNPPRTGYGIPLISIGRTSHFYPDFLLWRNDDVFAIDTTGEHLIREKAWRKLLSIMPSAKVRERLYVRLVTKGRFNEASEQTGKDGYTVWRLRADQKMALDYTDDLEGAVALCLRGDVKAKATA